MDLFRISRELPFHFHSAREKEHFYRGERKLGGYTQRRVHGFSLTQFLPGKKRSVLRVRILFLKER